ncbi:MAG: hypothetical protein M3N91_18415 [Pseudomonadota bacterium]|nr:hypothetical protein [Pseudomonadota bacterium]
MSSANVMSVIVTCTTVPFTVLANQPPNVGYLSLLLTDGSVMVQSDNPMCRRPQRLAQVRWLSWPMASLRRP